MKEKYMQTSRRKFLKGLVITAAVGPFILPSRVWTAPTGPNGKLTIRCARALSVNGCDQSERQVFGLTAYEAPDVLEMPEGKGYFPQWGVESLGVAGIFE